MENQYMIHIASVPVSVQKEKWSSTVIVYIVGYTNTHSNLTDSTKFPGWLWLSRIKKHPSFTAFPSTTIAVRLDINPW